MKRICMAIGVVYLAGAALAGGVTEPAMDPAVVAEAASSGGDNWVGFMMLALTLGTALAK
ncbi:MAG: hypothetical protein WCC57_13340 [Paracoccaceae bacterium]